MTKRKITGYDTPTYKRIGGVLDEWFDTHNIQSGLNLKSCEDLMTRLTLAVENESTREAVATYFLAALDEAQTLAQRDDETRKQVERLTFSLTVGAAWLIQEIADLQIESERSNNIIASNAGKTTAKGYAISRARLRLKEDSEQQLRMGELADLVYRDLVGTEHENYLPGRMDGVRKWLAEGDLPTYLSKRGRPKETR